MRYGLWIDLADRRIVDFRNGSTPTRGNWTNAHPSAAMRREAMTDA